MFEHKEQKPIKLRIALDFDGTMTALKGSDTVSSDLYQSLIDEKNAVQAVEPVLDEFDEPIIVDGKEVMEPVLNAEGKPKWDPMSSKFKENLVELLKSALEKKENEDFKIFPESIEFIKTMLSHEADVVICSRNQKEYIAAMLEIASLDKSEIAKITIYDEKDLEKDPDRSKEEILKQHVKVKGKAEIGFAYDDNADDHGDMMDALKESCKQVEGSREATGGFKWRDIAKDVAKAAGFDTPQLKA